MDNGTLVEVKKCIAPLPLFTKTSENIDPRGEM